MLRSALSSVQGTGCLGFCQPLLLPSSRNIPMSISNSSQPDPSSTLSDPPILQPSPTRPRINSFSAFDLNVRNDEVPSLGPSAGDLEGLGGWVVGA